MVTPISFPLSYSDPSPKPKLPMRSDVATGKGKLLAVKAHSLPQQEYVWVRLEPGEALDHRHFGEPLDDEQRAAADERTRRRGGKVPPIEDSGIDARLTDNRLR